MFKFIYPLIIMVIVLVTMKHFVPFNITSRFNAIMIIAVYALIGAAIYFAITFKNGVFKDIFGERFLKKIKK